MVMADFHQKIEVVHVDDGLLNIYNDEGPAKNMLQTKVESEQSRSIGKLGLAPADLCGRAKGHYSS